MHPLLENIFTTRTFKNSKGEEIKIHSHTVREQCVFIQNIIQENHFKDTIELGFAYGISSLAIVEEAAKLNGRHFVIDKFENTLWDGNGLDLLKQAGYLDHVEFFEQYCYEVLPRLMYDNKRFDFAYVDSTKQFDWVLVDFFYLDKLLKIGGVVVFDDVDWPGIRKLLRYISRFPNYKICGAHPGNKSIVLSRELKLLMKFSKFRNLLRNNLLTTDSELGINTHCVALQKTDDDKRNWDWHVDF
jgi:predicted O-methyltransferase YrrM